MEAPRKRPPLRKGQVQIDDNTFTQVEAVIDQLRAQALTVLAEDERPKTPEEELKSGMVLLIQTAMQVLLSEADSPDEIKAVIDGMGIGCGTAIEIVLVPVPPLARAAARAMMAKDVVDGIVLGSSLASKQMGTR